MKPLHVVVLVVAAGAAGAILMNVAHRQGSTETPAVVQNQPPATVEQPAAPAPEAASAPLPPAEKPSALPKRRETPRPEPAKRAGDPEPVKVAEAPAPSAPARALEPPPPAPVSAEPARAEPEPVAPAAPPAPVTATLTAGTLISVRLIDGLSTERNKLGDVFTGSLDRALAVDGFEIAPRGARVEGKVISSDPGGKVNGVASLAVQLVKLHTADGQTINLETDSFTREAEQSKADDAKKVGVGAAVGAIIGGIAGGGKGAAIGAGAGGAAGAGTVLLTRGKPATLPSETRIDFRLRTPVTVTERRQ